MNRYDKFDTQLKESSRVLYAQVFALKDSLHNELLERFKNEPTIAVDGERWKLLIMTASVSTALFSTVLSGNKNFLLLYTYFKIKLKEYNSEAETKMDDCMQYIADLRNGVEYSSEQFSEAMVLWLYFSIRGKDQFAQDELAPYSIVGQFIHDYFYNWFDKNVALN